jgi:hypothetical protein
VLIRFNRSSTVGIGTVIRPSAGLTVLIIGFQLKTIPGIVVGASAVAAGVISEAIYAGLAVRPVIKNELKTASPVPNPVTLRSFLSFYIPLAMTSLLGLIVQPIGSAALSRMPQEIPSLATWQVVVGLVFLFRSAGMAYNEVVVALLDEPRSAQSLRRFTGLMTAAVTLLLLLFAATPLSWIWFRDISGLSPELARLAVIGVWLALPMPGLNVLQSWYQGAILHSRRTRHHGSGGDLPGDLYPPSDSWRNLGQDDRPVCRPGGVCHRHVHPNDMAVAPQPSSARCRARIEKQWKPFLDNLDY